jgi:hypothetical protein
MKHQLTDHHKRHLKKIGVSEVSDALHIPFKEYDEHHRAWKRTLPHASDEEIHKRVLANVAWRRQNAQPSAEPVPVVTQTQPAPVHISVDHRRELRWLAAAIGIVALLLLFTGRAHAQFSKISSIQWQQSGSNISGGFVASPFIINCGANMACSASGTTITIASSATAGTAWDSITNPAAGALTLNQFANGNTFLKVLRRTDTTPTGNFFDFQNAAGTTLCKLDITGLFSSCTFPYGSLTGTPSTFAPTAHNLFSASHGDTVAASPVRGDIIIANSTPAWTKLAIGTTGLYPKSNGTDIVNSTMAASGVGACGANTWASTLNGDAVPTCTQPAFTNLSGSISVGQSQSLSGDVTGAVNATVVGKVNGVAFSASPATDTIPVITAAGTATYKAIPDCQDSSGNHLNYTASTHAVSCGTSSSGSGSTSLDPTTFRFENEFLMGSSTSVDVYFTAGCDFGGCPTGSWTAGTANHPGIFTSTASGTTAGNAAIIRPLSGTTASIPPLNVAGWTTVWIFKIASTSNQRLVFGLGDSVTCGLPANGIWVRYDTSLADTKYTFEARSASTSTTSTTNSVNADTSFHTVKARSTSAGTVLFSIDGGTETSIATNVPTVGLFPVFVNCNASGSAAAAVLSADYFGFLWTGLTR